LRGRPPRIAAGASGFFTLTQSAHRPDRYGRPARAGCCREPPSHPPHYWYKRWRRREHRAARQGPEQRRRQRLHTL